uniref:ING domain-containing protein n=1 Tax=Globodera pallida TaxID=36090 RepID=A0A183CC41_GLOPA
MADIYEKCLKNAQPIQQKMEENLYNIRILDATIKQIEKELKQKLTQMANTLKKTSKDERRRQYEAIEKLYERAKNLSDDKIQLAESNYEMVDVFIQKLDKETSSFNSFAECVQRVDPQHFAEFSFDGVHANLPQLCS